MKVKIATGWSKPGGSTLTFMKLQKMLEAEGHECIIYGKHDWHLDKCNGDRLERFQPEEDDRLIVHFLPLAERLPVAKQIFSVHETSLVDLKKVRYSAFDAIHFVSDYQVKWHCKGGATLHPKSVIIPPEVEEIDCTIPNTNTAGVIGSIDSNKRTDKAIRKALGAGFDKVLLFGDINDQSYYDKFVEEYVKKGKAVLMGHVEDKALMYSQVDAVFHASKQETFGLIEAECKYNGIPFYGFPEFNPKPLTPDKILKRWTKLLELV